tara:strand:- start:2 stop:1756 length:1755 start_codon:yes stop_codon:yes gene_type:complete
MAFAQRIITSNSAGDQEFTFTFDYIKEEHIKVFVNFAEINQGTGSNEFQVITNTTPKKISLNTGLAADNTRVEIKRISSLNTPLVDFTDGSTLTASDLDTAEKQSLFIDQELDDSLKQGLSIDPTTGLPTLNNQKLTNVADPTNAQDVVTKNYLERTGSITSTQIADGTIVDADINASAAIAGSKLQAASGSNAGSMSAANFTKLANIETAATADQTAAEIRSLVESASDSNVFTDADHNKLDNIEANATADQTNAEIRAAVEAASDSNVFTDADHTKLNGISAGADVTSTNSINALTDVNTSGVADGKILKYQASSSSFVIADDTGGGGGSSAFTGLSDTPLNFTGAANKLLIVNSNSNAIEFVNTLAGDITFADDIKVKFGAGNDLEIYHNSSDEFSYIRETNATGSLRIQGEQLIFEDLAGDNYIYCLHDAEVRLYYDNAAKLYTTSYGIEVRGDGNTGDGTLQLNCSQNSHGIKLKSPPHSAAQSYTLTFPSSILANGFLKTDANGNLSFAAVDTDLVNDTSPQLGGNLDMQSNNITGTGTITANSVASNANGMRKITTSTSDPTSSDGADGDVWFTYAS